jgi:hypothetical protein
MNTPNLLSNEGAEPKVVAVALGRLSSITYSSTGRMYVRVYKMKDCCSKVQPPAKSSLKIRAARNKTGKLGERFDQIYHSLPESEWDKLPTDLAVNHDYYLHGLEKES